MKLLQKDILDKYEKKIERMYLHKIHTEILFVSQYFY